METNEAQSDHGHYHLSEEELTEHLQYLLRVDSEIKRWSCPCGAKDCQTFVLYGVGVDSAGHRVLWVMCSIVEDIDDIPFGGLDASDDVDDLWARHDNSEDPSEQDWANLIASCFEGGLRRVLAAELALLKAN